MDIFYKEIFEFNLDNETIGFLKFFSQKYNIPIGTIIEEAIETTYKNQLDKFLKERYNINPDIKNLLSNLDIPNSDIKNNCKNHSKILKMVSTKVLTNFQLEQIADEIMADYYNDEYYSYLDKVEKISASIISEINYENMDFYGLYKCEIFQHDNFVNVDLFKKLTPKYNLTKSSKTEQEFCEGLQLYNSDYYAKNNKPIQFISELFNTKNFDIRETNHNQLVNYKTYELLNQQKEFKRILLEKQNKKSNEQ